MNTNENQNHIHTELTEEQLKGVAGGEIRRRIRAKYVCGICRTEKWKEISPNENPASSIMEPHITSNSAISSTCNSPLMLEDVEHSYIRS